MRLHIFKKIQSIIINETLYYITGNDPYIKLEDLEDFAKSIDAKPVVYEDSGHFNESAGYTTFEDLLKFI